MQELKRRRGTLPSEHLQPQFRLVRAIQAPHQLVKEPDGTWRISSKAFDKSSGPDASMSGDLEQLLVSDGLVADTLYRFQRRAVGAATIRISDILHLNLSVKHDPVDDNWYHGGVYGIKGNKKQRLYEKAEVLVPIDQAAANRFDEQFTRLKLKAANSSAAG